MHEMITIKRYYTFVEYCFTRWSYTAETTDFLILKVLRPKGVKSNYKPNGLLRRNKTSEKLTRDMVECFNLL